MDNAERNNEYPTLPVNDWEYDEIIFDGIGSYGEGLVTLNEPDGGDEQLADGTGDEVDSETMAGAETDGGGDAGDLDNGGLGDTKGEGASDYGNGDLGDSKTGGPSEDS